MPFPAPMMRQEILRNFKNFLPQQAMSYHKTLKILGCAAITLSRLGGALYSMWEPITAKKLGSPQHQQHRSHER
jgi:hypothetical protein